MIIIFGRRIFKRCLDQGVHWGKVSKQIWNKQTTIHYLTLLLHCIC